MVKRFENNDRWKHFLDQLLNDLEGISEYAIADCCAWFRKYCDSAFFPNYKEFVDTAKQIDEEIKLMKRDLK